MACNDCPKGVTTENVGTTRLLEPHAQVQTDTHIPIKVGHPLSTACERATHVGQIPRVINFPGFTLVGGGVVTGVPSNGGISEARMASFFEDKGKECYKSRQSRLASTCC